MDQTLKNQGALVTGGSRGIGAAVVKRPASEGAKVALTSSSAPERASKAVKTAQAFGVHALAIQTDSAEAGAVIAAVERTASELGGLDILVNNAGIAIIGPLATFKLTDLPSACPSPGRGVRHEQVCSGANFVKCMFLPRERLWRF